MHTAFDRWLGRTLKRMGMPIMIMIGSGVIALFAIAAVFGLFNIGLLVLREIVRTIAQAWHG